MKRITTSIAFLLLLAQCVKAEDSLYSNVKISADFFKLNSFQTNQIPLIDSLAKKVGEDAIYTAFQEQITQNQRFDFSNEAFIRSYISEAEIFLHAEYYAVNGNSTTLYKAMGDQMLTVLADTLAKAIDKKLLKANAPFTVYLINRLADNHKFIDIKTSNFVKIWRYLLEGRFDYVFHKLTTTYVDVTIQFFAVLLVLLVLFIFRKEISIKTGGLFKKMKPLSILHTTIVSSCIVVLFSTVLVSQKSCAQPPPQSSVVTLCDLIQLEDAINKCENATQEKLRILGANPPLAAPVFRSVWEDYTSERPRKMFPNDLMSCDKRLLDPYSKDDLIRLLSIAKGNRLALESSQQPQLARYPSFSNKFTQQTPQQVAYAQLGQPKIVTTQVQLENISKPEASIEIVQHIAPIRHQKNEQDYACIIVNPQSKEVKIDFLWKDDSGHILGSFARSIDHLHKHNKKPLMLMNAGIFNEKYSPLGAFYANGKKICKFNDKQGEGNFYMNPAGIFIIEKNGTAKIKTREEYLASIADTVNIKHATQSGPMLLIDGQIHPMFNANSTNRFIRNGVGVRADGRIVFVMSEQPVTFYEFAEVFRTKFKCTDALYLDGAISRMYMPDLDLRTKSGGFAGIIAVSDEQ